MVERGFGDHTALIGQGRLRTYKELSDWTNRLARALVEDLGIVPGNRILIRSANNPAMVACWFAALKAGRGRHQHRADAPRRRSDEGDRQGGSEARALRHAPDRRAGHGRQDQQVPEEGDRLRRHGQFRRRARSDRARQARAFRSGRDRRATTSRSSPSRPARPASRRRRCISTAIFSPSPTATRRKCSAITPDDIIVGTPPLAFTFGLGALVIFPLRFGAASRAPGGWLAVRCC